MRAFRVFRCESACQHVFEEVAKGGGLAYKRLNQGRPTVVADFQYDVFLSHSAKDKAVVRPLAERLR